MGPPLGAGRQGGLGPPVHGRRRPARAPPGARRPGGQLTTAWLEVDAALARSASGSARPAALAVFAALRPIVDPGAGPRKVSCFFFQRKPPDLRLRFGAGDLAAVGAAVEAALEGPVGDGHVTRWWTAVYEPEERKFGGPAAMEAVHAWFDADTRAWLRLATEPNATGEAPHPAVVCAAVANDLYGRALGDADEVWDTWRNVQDRLAGIPPAPLPVGRWPALDELEESLPASVVAGYRTADEELAGGLRRAAEAGALTAGRRAILPFVSQHTFQRWGLDGPAQAEVARVMAAAWDPHRGMRGG
ncbi:MAG TPA: thiopeptide-type bacteriocin biosynthesis protein [Acidimicrobiales bacterium]|nr:thiopeptide-type bacteriocin biosynthesis protein [Acidimicrobiales bacterium]